MNYNNPGPCYAGMCECCTRRMDPKTRELFPTFVPPRQQVLMITEHGYQQLVQQWLRGELSAPPWSQGGCE